MKKYTVYIIAIVCSLSFLLLFSGFLWTIYNQFFGTKNTEVVVIEDKNTVTKLEGKMILALGDSLTRGTGDEAGKGYVGYLIDQLQEKSEEEISFLNLGVKGYRSDQLLDLVKQKATHRQAKNADTILITIGGNDLFQSGQTLMEFNQTTINKLKEAYLNNLQEIITELRLVNKKATIYVVGLYNPFINYENADLTTKVVREWNFDTSILLDEDNHAVFVPTFDLFQLKMKDYLYTDQFHPNSEGYKLIAERVASLITW
jgi:lysophospholipase L1-like esterase